MQLQPLTIWSDSPPEQVSPSPLPPPIGGGVLQQPTATAPVTPTPPPLFGRNTAAPLGGVSGQPTTTPVPYGQIAPQGQVPLTADLHRVLCTRRRRNGDWNLYIFRP